MILIRPLQASPQLKAGALLVGTDSDRLLRHRSFPRGGPRCPATSSVSSRPLYYLQAGQHCFQSLALMVQQFTAIEWGTESRPFPRLFDIARGRFDQQFWLPMLAPLFQVAMLRSGRDVSRPGVHGAD